MNTITMFIFWVIMGITLNPMNLLAFRLDHIYFSMTLLYGGLLMASNMLWGHQVLNYQMSGNFDRNLFFAGIGLALVSIMLLRSQLFVNDREWLKRMISHHSTALTTSHKIKNKTKNKKVKKLAEVIIDTQEKEIQIMEDLLTNK